MTLIATVLQRRILYVGLVVLLLMTVAVQSVVFQSPQVMGRDAEITDFTAYHIAGDMTLQGRAAEAYDWRVVRQEQWRRYHELHFMPWAYPPQFTVVAAALATMPIGLSYLGFALSTMLFFLIILWKLCGKWSTAGILFMLPAIIVNARCGQNGFLTAGLIGAFLLYYRTEWLRSGLALGAMVVKPHLAVGIAFVALIDWKWRRILVAAAVVVGSAALATLALGSEIWAAFFQSTRDASKFMNAGNYPLDRMTSVYAMLSRFGISSSLAIAAHALVALATIYAVWRGFRCGLEPLRLGALIAFCSVMISPYNYDYDLCALAFAAGLLAPAVLSRARQWEIACLFVLAWVGSSNAFISEKVKSTYDLQYDIAGSYGIKSYSALFITALAIWTWAILRREPRFEVTDVEP